MTTESEILDEVIAPGAGGLSRDAAQSLLELQFPPRALRRMRQLINRGSSGELSADDEIELDRYRRVGLLIDLVQAKARASLARNGGAT